MKAIVYTYQGEEFRGDIPAEPFVNVPAWMTGYQRYEIQSPEGHLLDRRIDQTEIVWLDQEDGTRVYLRPKDIRAVITDLLEDVLASDDPPSSGDAPQPSEPPSESSAPEGT